MPPLQQAAALYEHRVTLPSETQVKIATLGDQLAELRASMAALQARIDLLARW